MADEITVVANISVQKDSFRHQDADPPVRVDMAGDGGGNPGTVTVTTSEAVLAFTGITTLGYCKIKNLDDTNYVDYGPESGGAMVGCLRLNAGESAVFRLKPGVTWRAQADTASVKLRVLVFDN